MIRISLVIATYNRAEQLMTTLESVVGQSFDSQRWECVVVDNNSSDSTRERIEAFVRDHATQNFRYVFEPEQGLSAARNAGIRASRGEIIAFIDDDERIVEGFWRHTSTYSIAARRLWWQVGVSSPSTPQDDHRGCRATRSNLSPILWTSARG